MDTKIVAWQHTLVLLSYPPSVRTVKPLSVRAVALGISCSPMFDESFPEIIRNRVN